MNRRKALDFLERIEKCKQFLSKYPDNEIIINENIDVGDIKRMNDEYPELLPLNINNPEINKIVSITAVSRTIGPNGYPKLRIYLKKESMEIIRTLISE